ncbi:Dirigent protein [Quillaja saponaria]|uniref:Dirigent protein n=1 Tax=Quillaja saponaria TaxID=32244 RepID=A0AAD7PYA6_QUISA|nr:Dirigent protein [Quillaja saponaria]
MARAASLPTLISTFFIIITFLFSTSITAENHHFSQNLSPASIGLKREKLSHLHFYFHDIVSGRNPTAVRVAEADVTNSSSTLFGATVMIDDPLTVQPEISSKLVGRAQGIYASASQTEAGLLMVLNFAFMEGKYNGSTLSVLGRNMVFSTVRELPIVGGSGLFRFARGYAQARTHWFDLKTGDAVVEYNAYVFHY